MHNIIQSGIRLWSLKFLQFFVKAIDLKFGRHIYHAFLTYSTTLKFVQHCLIPLFYDILRVNALYFLMFYTFLIVSLTKLHSCVLFNAQ